MRTVMIAVVGWVGLAGGVSLAQSQTLPSPESPAPVTVEQAPPPAGAKPAAPAGQAPAAQAPAPAAQAAAAPAADAVDTRSLFAQTWRQAQISGRWASIDGDPARYQRYEDLRNGLLFTDARFARENDDWLFRVGADNVGWRDQRLFGAYERTGKFVVSGKWDQIPQFYSVDTSTPYTPAPGSSPLLLDDSIQRSIQNGQATTTAYLPVATQFDLRERRDIGTVTGVITPSKELDIKTTYTTTKHSGELPWGASYGFSNDVEVALPYDSRTNDFSIGAELSKSKGMIRVAYDGSWFNNLDDTLVWDSPLRADDAATVPGRGRMALWPSNSAQTFSVAGSTKFKKRTQLTGFVSFGSRSNDEPLQAFTINPLVTPQLALPRATTEGSASIFSTNISLVSRPITDWRFSARVRHYGYDNGTPVTAIPQFINYDTSVTTSKSGGPQQFAHSRTSFDTDATWTGLPSFALTAGYTHNSTGHEFRTFEGTGENILTLKADTVGSQWVTFRANYEFADRSGSGLDENELTVMGEQPAMRQYDIADRTRNRFTGQVDITPNEVWTLSASLGTGKDDFKDSYFGLQESSFRVFSLGADFQQATGLGGGASYNYERYTGLQASRSASPGQTPDQVTDPNRDWTSDSFERVHYFSIYVTPPRIGARTEARFSYDYAHSSTDTLLAVVPGGPLPVPSQLPQVFNKLQELKLDIRHRLSKAWIATFSYAYEPFDVFDYAFDPSVVDSIVQPSSLVLGHVYRPYTAHSLVFGVRYVF